MQDKENRNIVDSQGNIIKSINSKILFILNIVSINIPIEENNFSKRP